MKSKKISAAELIDKYFGTIYHFAHEGAGGWGLLLGSKEQFRVTKKEATELCKNLNCLTITKNKDGNEYLELKKNGKFPPEVMVEFWKKMYEDEVVESDRLYNLFKEFSKKVDG